MCLTLKKPFVNLIILTVLIALLFGIGLGSRPYSAPSESRYIEIGREMAESGDYVTPRLDYVKYFEKPAGFYWIQALNTKFFGLSEFAVRVPTALFAVALCLLTYLLGSMLYGNLAGWLGSLVLATSLYVFALSRVVLVDMPVSVFIVATLAAFLYVVRAPGGCKRTIVLYAMYAAAAWAVLTKGLIGIILPGAVIFIWLALTGKWSVLKNLNIFSGLILFLAIVVPWHWLVAERNPEFLHFYFIHEHFERYLTKTHGRYQPDWFFAVVLVAGLFPWVGFSFQSVFTGLRGFWQTRKKDGTQLFLLLWISIIFIFFSLSDSKLIPYILPIFPVLTVLIGNYFAELWKEKPQQYFKTGLLITLLLLLATAMTPSMLNRFLDADSKVMEAVSQAGDDLSNLSIAAMIAAAAILITYIQGEKKHLIIVLIISAALIIQLGDIVAGHYNKDSMKAVALAIKMFSKQGDEVALLDEYNQDLPAYLQRKVTVVSWPKTELSFGAEHENASAWMINQEVFWKRWMKDDHLMFVVMRYETFNELTKNKNPDQLHLNIINQYGRNLLFTNELPVENNQGHKK